MGTILAAKLLNSAFGYCKANGVLFVPLLEILMRRSRALEITCYLPRQVFHNYIINTLQSAFYSFLIVYSMNLVLEITNGNFDAPVGIQVVKQTCYNV